MAIGGDTLKLDRLISILVLLLRKERVQAKELAEMFEVSVRTILRDVDALNLAGIPIVTFQGINGGIGIAEGFRLDKSVLNSSEMATILSMLRGAAKSMPDTKGHNILVEKIKNTLSSSQIEQLDQKSKELIVDLSPWGRFENIQRRISIIKDAINRSIETRINYKDANGVLSKRIVEPYSLILKGQKWYLYGWCKMREDFRFFKVSRIKDIELSEDTFEKRNITEEQMDFQDEWVTTEKSVELELVFSEVIKDVLEDWFGNESIEIGEGRFIGKINLPDNDKMYGFLLSFGGELEVVSPSHIRSNLKEIAEKIYNQY